MRITPEGGSPVLIVELAIDCDICGEVYVQIAGHHLRALTAALAGVIEDYPDLCGNAGSGVTKSSWQGTSPGAGKETLN